MEDRFCIESGGKTKVILSQQDLVSCGPDDGCDGGFQSDALQFAVDHGLVSAACYPYEMGTCHHPGCSEEPTPPCNQTCANGQSWQAAKVFASQAYAVGSDANSMMQEIFAHGPVAVSFDVYQDFANYKSVRRVGCFSCGAVQCSAVRCCRHRAGRVHRAPA